MQKNMPLAKMKQRVPQDDSTSKKDNSDSDDLLVKVQGGLRVNMPKNSCSSSYTDNTPSAKLKRKLNKHQEMVMWEAIIQKVIPLIQKCL